MPIKQLERISNPDSDYKYDCDTTSEVRTAAREQAALVRARSS
jgi:hypothetical protein